MGLPCAGIRATWGYVSREIGGKMKQGQKVLIMAEVDAMRTGFMKKEIRVKLKDTTLWVRADEIIGEETEASR